MFEKYKRVFIFDTETSGLSPQYDEIIELGGLLLTKPEGSKKFTDKKEVSVLIKNKNPITNSHIHHITEQMCQKDGIEKAELFEILKDIFGENKDDTLIVAYNAPFDIRFVNYFLKSFDKNYKIKNPILDLLIVAKNRTHRIRGNKLCNMIEYYDVKNVQNSHRAIDDVYATFEVMKAMILEKPDLEKYIYYERE